MAIGAPYEGSASISSAWSLPNNAAYNAANVITTDGIYELVINLSNMTATEQYLVELHEKCLATSAVARVTGKTFSGVQSDPLQKLPLGMLLHGWDVVVTKLQGTTSTIEWSIRAVT